METTEAPVDHTITVQESVTEAMRPSAAELAKARRQLHVKASVIGAMAIGSYWLLLTRAMPIFGTLITTAVLIIALTAAATCVFHDANHASFSTSRGVNRVAGYTGDLLGASSWVWRFKHNNLHHGNTNMVGIDADIDQAPFARLAPEQRWRPWHRYQHVYMWGLYGFLTLEWLLISDFVDLKNQGIGPQRFARRPRRRDILMLALGKCLHIGWAIALPLAYHSWWVVLTFYLVISWSVGLVLATMFQLAHCSQPAEFPEADVQRRGGSFVAHQLRTTVDVHCRTRLGGNALHWVMGGLDFQVEHHLAPRLPHTIYPLVAKRLSRVCEQQDLTIHAHATPWRAIVSHGRWLKAMGARP